MGWGSEQYGDIEEPRRDRGLSTWAWSEGEAGYHVPIDRPVNYSTLRLCMKYERTGRYRLLGNEELFTACAITMGAMATSVYTYHRPADQ